MEASFNAENTWSDTLIVPAGNFNLSIWGIFSATITVQRSFNNGVIWLDVQPFTIPGEYKGLEPEGSRYRVGIKTGEYVSGTANIRMAV